MEIKDLREYPNNPLSFYGGNAGQKYGIIIDGEKWIVKFPASTRDFSGQKKKNTHLPSYTLSPESEYIGSHIYELIGIPVHKTILGFRDNKIVVACKDFTTPSTRLIEFGAIKNTIDGDKFISETNDAHSGSCGCIDDVLYTIDNAPVLKNLPKIKEHFWDMFVVDSFIKNNDRNNGNWGILYSSDGSYKIAPVYDNGNCFFNKRNDSAAASRLNDVNSIKQDVIDTNTSFFKNKNGHSLKPMNIIKNMENDNINNAVLRIVEKIDIKKIIDLINEIPETAFDKIVITSNQKQLYIEMLKYGYENVLKPTYDKLVRTQKNKK